MANPSAIALGAGLLYVAPLGSTEPSDLTTSWSVVDTDWTALGYTEEGSEFSYSLDTEDVEVAEELDPIRVVPTGRQIAVSFALAEITATNLKRAMNGGTITSGSGIVTFEPPAIGEETRVMLGWQSEDGEERWVFRQCMQSGEVTMARRKGATKATIACNFRVEKPAAGGQPFKAIFDSTNRG